MSLYISLLILIVFYRVKVGLNNIWFDVPIRRWRIKHDQNLVGSLALTFRKFGKEKAPQTLRLVLLHCDLYFSSLYLVFYSNYTLDRFFYPTKFGIIGDSLLLFFSMVISGYSFSLTWINKLAGEAEILYRVLSLGTFERVAPEWMKEAIIFSTSMCPTFLEKVTRVIKLHC